MAGQYFQSQIHLSCSTEGEQVALLQVALVVDQAEFGSYGFMANTFCEWSSEKNIGAEVLELTEAGERASQICNAGPLLGDTEDVGAKTG